MAPRLRWAILALLAAAPAVAVAQQQQGDARAPEQLSRAKALIEKRRYRAALALFDSLTRDQPRSRDVVLGRAQTLAWLGRISEAVRAYERWVAEHPNDLEALERLARALSWAGRHEDAERVYKLLALAGAPEAERGLARVAAARGDLAESERRWRTIAARRPADAEAWVGLAQVLRWTNRPREARAALSRAVAADAANGEAAEQLRSVEAALAPHVDPSVVSMSDSDGNHITTTGATLGVAAPWDGQLSLQAHRRTATLAGTSASSLGAIATATWATARLVGRGSLGVARLNDATASGARRDVLAAAAALSARLGRRARVGVSASRGAFDETAPLIRRGIAATAYGAGGSLELGRRLSLSGEFERARLTGGTPNTRTGGSASLRWRAPRVLSVAASTRAFGYGVDARDGYFAPARYLLAEGSARIEVGRERGWSVTLDGGLGAQSMDAWSAGSATRPAARGSGAITFRPTPRLEWSLSTSVANAVAPGTATLTSYRAMGWATRGRVSF